MMVVVACFTCYPSAIVRLQDSLCPSIKGLLCLKNEVQQRENGAKMVSQMAVNG
jgi:hypothetical protein